MKLLQLPGRYAICRLPVDAPLPAWAIGGNFSSVTRTADEVSVVVSANAVPLGVRCEPGWCCLRVAGTLDLALVGVLAALAEPFASAGVSVFAISTFDTDYLLVRERDLDRAAVALAGKGHDIRGPSEL